VTGFIEESFVAGEDCVGRRTSLLTRPFRRGADVPKKTKKPLDLSATLRQVRDPVIEIAPHW